MACSHPYLIQNDKVPLTSFNMYDRYVPCGMCLNCRVDKQNSLTHRCEYELIKYKCGAFVTVTYDDYHILDKLRIDKDGNLVATLSKRDCVKFLDRLRQNIKRNLPDNILSNHHFKYLVVGEYGGHGQVFDRPHMHFLFFGLDFAYCKKMFERSWQGQGMVEVLPILNGGIRYVLKYLDKQLFGKQAEQKYDENNIERPFQNHSLGLGAGLYQSQLDYINSHKGCYRWKGKDIPVPMYYKNKFLIKSYRLEKWKNLNIKYKEINGRLLDFTKPRNFYDLHNFNIKQNLIKEKNLNEKLSLSGKPRFDFMPFLEKVEYSKKYISDLAQKAYIAQVPF